MAKGIQDALNFRLTATLLHSWNVFLGKGRIWSRYLSETLPIQSSSFKWLTRIFSGFGIKSDSDESPLSNVVDEDIANGRGFVSLFQETFSSCLSPPQDVGPRLMCDPFIVSKNFENTVTILNNPCSLRSTDTRSRVTVRMCCREVPPLLPFQVVHSIFRQERRALVNQIREREISVFGK